MGKPVYMPLYTPGTTKHTFSKQIRHVWQGTNNVEGTSRRMASSTGGQGQGGGLRQSDNTCNKNTSKTLSSQKKKCDFCVCKNVREGEGTGRREGRAQVINWIVQDFG